MRIVWVVFCAAAALCGCARDPIFYAPPQQFQMPLARDPVTEIRLLTMNEPDVTFSIIDGVPDAGHGFGFKWTLDQAHFRLIAGDLSNSDFFMHYALDSTTFHDRHSVRITIVIKGKRFDSFIESTEGQHEHRRAAGAIKSKNVEALDVSLTIEPPWIAPDGT